MLQNLQKTILALAVVAIAPVAAMADDVSITNLGDCSALEDSTNVVVSFDSATVVMMRYTSDSYKAYVADATGGIELASGMIGNIFIEYGMTEGKQLDGGAIKGLITFTNGVPMLNTSSSTGSSTLPTISEGTLTPTALTIPGAQDSAYLCTLVKISSVTISEDTTTTTARRYVISDVNGETLNVHDDVVNSSYDYILADLSLPTELNYITGVLALSGGAFALYPMEIEENATPAVYSIGEAAELDDGTEVKMYFTDAVITAWRVTLDSQTAAYIEDGTGGMQMGSSLLSIMFSDSDADEGWQLDGGPIYGTINKSNGMTIFNTSDETSTMGYVPEATEVEVTPTTLGITDITDDYLCCLVKISGELTLTDGDGDGWNWFTLTDGDGNTLKGRDYLYYQASESSWIYIMDDFYNGSAYTESTIGSITGIVVSDGTDYIIYPTAYSLESDDSEDTGISVVTTSESNLLADGIYNVGGMRVNGANLSKGVYIINGRKVSIK